MNPDLIFVPVLLQVLVTLYAYLLLAREKAKAVRDGTVNEQRRALHDDAWPYSVIKVNNSVAILAGIAATALVSGS